MQEMAKDIQAAGDKARTATSSMCTFLILNISSLQLIPVTLIALPERIWVKAAGGGAGTGAGCNGNFYAGGGGFL